MNITHQKSDYNDNYREDSNPCRGAENPNLYINGERIVNIEIDGDVKPSIFACYPQIQNVFISNYSVINDCAFNNCSNATITIPTSVTTLSYSSLYGVKQIRYLGTEEQWNNIQFGEYAYEGCL